MFFIQLYDLGWFFFQEALELSSIDGRKGGGRLYWKIMVKYLQYCIFWNFLGFIFRKFSDFLIIFVLFILFNLKKIINRIQNLCTIFYTERNRSFNVENISVGYEYN